MVRISAIFIAVCMIVIAGSLGVVLYLRFGFTAAEAALVGVGVLTALTVYNTIAGRKRDRAEVSEQVANLARGTGDLARQLAEYGRQLHALEDKVETAYERALATAQPLAIEIEELSRLVKELADTLAVHESTLSRLQSADQRPIGPPALAPLAAPGLAPAQVTDLAIAPAPAADTKVAAFRGLSNEAIITAVRDAIEERRVELYLQPIVTLPQRKVRYYEALLRLRAANGDLIAAADFLRFAELGGLMSKLDNLSVLRSVQVVRRLLLKNRDIGLFCNMAGVTLADAIFPQLLEFAEANRAIASSLVFEFTQSAVRAMGPIEYESLAALAERGFRFSMDNLTDLRVEPRELTDRGFRFIKAPAGLLLSRAGAGADIHPADLSDLLGRFGIDLIAERIETEATVVDLLDYDVRFAQGFLFSPPRPVRAEALQGVAPEAKSEAAKANGDTAVDLDRLPSAHPPASPTTEAAPAVHDAGGHAQLSRNGLVRS